MSKSRGAQAIEDLAAQNGVSVEEIRREIEIAIDAAIANPDPEAQKQWEQILKDGRKPTPEEFIEYMADKIRPEFYPD